MDYYFLAHIVRRAIQAGHLRIPATCLELCQYNSTAHLWITYPDISWPQHVGMWARNEYTGETVYMKG